MLLGSAQWSTEKTTVCTVCEALQTTSYTHTFCTLLKMQFVVDFAVPLNTVPESKTLTDCNSSLSLRYLTLKMSVFSGLLSKHKRSNTIIEQVICITWKDQDSDQNCNRFDKLLAHYYEGKKKSSKTVRKIVQINHQRQGICNVVSVCSFMRQSWGKKKQLLKNNIEASEMYLSCVKSSWPLKGCHESQLWILTPLLSLMTKLVAALSEVEVYDVIQFLCNDCCSREFPG